MTPEELRRRADETDARAETELEAGRPLEAAALFLRADQDRTAAAEMERLGKAKGLPVKLPSRTIHGMSIDTRGFSADVKRGVGRSTRKHPAQTKLYAKGVTISALAKELRETRARVSSWMNPGKETRAIPRHHAEYLREHYGIPLSAWARISD